MIASINSRRASLLVSNVSSSSFPAVRNARHRLPYAMTGKAGKRHTRGTGLVEMMGAFVILGLGLMALTQVAIYGIHSNATAGRRTRAFLLAQERMSEILAARNNRGYLVREYGLDTGNVEPDWRSIEPRRGQQLLEWRPIFQKMNDDGLYIVAVEVKYALSLKSALMGEYRLDTMLSLPPGEKGGA